MLMYNCGFSFDIIMQVVVGGEVIEYISMEMGVIRLTGGEVALFHLSQVFGLVETPTTIPDLYWT